VTIKIEHWQRAVLDISKSIRESIVAMNETSLRIVLVVDADQKFVGTVGDGDIRRGMLLGLDLDSKLEIIVFKSPVTVHAGVSRSKVLAIMKMSRVHQIPIVDSDLQILGLHLWDETSFVEYRANIFFIVAGGLGTRLRPYTELLPKPMIKVDGKPMLQQIIEKAKIEGFRKFVIAVGYLGSVIEEYFKDGSEFDVEISYLHESEPLGTAGALKLIDPFPEKSIVVTNSDIVSDIQFGDILKFHEDQAAIATMATRIHDLVHPFGVIKLELGKISQIDEKPTIRTNINAGVYILSPLVFPIIQSFDREQFDMTDLFIELLNKYPQKVAAFPMYEEWIDVGQESDLLRANKDRS